MSISATTETAAQTQALAALLARSLRPGDALCLRGDLGAGKTTFVGGLVQAWGGTEAVVSPTFTLENRYPLDGSIPELVHADLYRGDGEVGEDLVGSLLEAREEGAVLAIEWGEPLTSVLAPYLDLRLELEGAKRHLHLQPVPEGWPRQEEVAAAWKKEVASWA